MILFVLCISAFLFFICFNLLTNNKVLHVSTSIVFAVLFILSTFFITINFHNHYGMHKVSHETSTKLVSSADKGMDMLLYQPIGTSGKDKVVIYRTDEKATKPSHTGTNKVTNEIITTNDSKAKFVTKTVKYEYNSSSNRLWFGLAQKPTRVRTYNYFYVPKSWMVLTVNQAKQLPTIIKEISGSNTAAQSQMKMAAEQYVQVQVKAAMMKNPKMTSAQQKALIKKATAEFTQKDQAEALQKMMPEIKQKLSQVK
ncbi:hypothetical protein AKUA2003_02700 [Apilactobacillus kunkeei]|nr:hypothetical protein AKUA2003_02700 [Apilactobacillus kunkeei]CAI2567444.1 hypothetical protein AKUA1001_02720 [Apilactobacillus kunkeei]CAI2801386.1 hypothetical protein AKUA2002_02700 [Apilactobacillus kunkeei]